ncbi:mitochondrial carrier [Tothia fuscella]|uniref:Mitochondrial carrier n=1 Tax=Tothia fuscella TaxID=1048955 RepID=A0A9P4NRL3_9PEZI|nr:mitochondrial carrier [Tothia fuscella]
MVLASVAKYFSTTGPTSTPLHQLTSGDDVGRREGGEYTVDMAAADTRRKSAEAVAEMEEFEAVRPPYVHAMLAGGLGGTTGDMLMHSLDTVKTRQQGDPHMPPKYTSMGSSYWTILRQEGVRRGLYGGVTPAFLGSFSGTVIFFGTYEWSKRQLLDIGLNPSLAYLSAGFIADLAASPLYVPSEVLKTRLQLQGRHNNPFFNSGYNYRGTVHAIRRIYAHEGFPALFHGYKATLVRDLPFSALQFAFYEQEQKLAKAWCGRRDIGLGLEIFTGATAGGMAGVITCPLDVVKTRIQTQHNPDIEPVVPVPKPTSKPSSSSQQTSAQPSKSHSPTKHSTSAPSSSSSTSNQQPRRPISTSSPSTSLKHHSAVTLDTSSVLTGLKVIYRTEGIAGWFRGVGPRAVWTSVQSGTMLVMYQTLLKWFDKHPLVGRDPTL